MAPLTDLKLGLSRRSNRQVANCEVHSASAVIRQLVIDVATAFLAQHDGIVREDIRVHPSLNREIATTVQKRLGAVRGHCHRVTRVEIEHAQYERAAAVGGIGLSGRHVPNRRAIVNAGYFLAIVKAVVIRVRQLRVGAVRLLIDI